MADLEGVVAGAYGVTHTLTLQNKQGAAQDVSSYTGEKTVYFRDPGNRITITSTCDFNDDGADGKIDFVFTNDSTPLFEGEWECQVDLNKTSVLAKTWPFSMYVEKSVGT